MDLTEHPGVPQRPPASAHLLIDSTDRYNQDTFLAVIGSKPYANDFSIQRSQALLYGYFTRIGITQVQFDWRIPTIIQGANDLLLFVNKTTGVSGEIILNPGFYTPLQMAAQIQARLTDASGAAAGAGATFTATWQESTRSIAIASNNTDAFYFSIPETWHNNAIALQPNQVKRVYKTYRNVGLAGANLDDATADDVLVLNTPICLYTDFVDIVSNRLTKYQRVKDADTLPANKTNIIARIYACPPGQRIEDVSGSALGSQPFRICVDYNTPKHMKWSSEEAINELDFRVYDQFGDLVPWNETIPWEFQLTMLASET